MSPVLIYLQPLDQKTGLRVDMRLGDGPNADVYGTGGVVWQPAISARPRLSLELMSPDMDGRVQAGRAQFDIALRQLDDPLTALRLYYKGAAVVIHSQGVLEGATAVPDFWGYVVSAMPNLDDGHITVTAEVSTVFIDKPLLTKEFSGGGGINGDAARRGTLLPAGFGTVKNIQPLWFDQVRNIGMIDGYGNTISIDWLGEGLSSFGPRVADYATYEALAAAIDNKAIKPGQWGTCVALGLVGLGAPPAGIITVHAVFGANRVGAIMKRMLLTHAAVPAARVDAAAFDALDALVPFPAHYWTADQQNVKERLEALAQSANATPIVTFQNAVTVTRAIGGAIVGTLDRSGSVEPRVIDWAAADVDPPYYLIKARAARPASVLTDDQVRFVDDLRDLGVYNAATVYRAGDLVYLSDGSQWLYQNATPAAGHAPPASAAPDGNGNVQDAWWFRRRPPVTAQSFTYVDGTPLEALKPGEGGANKTETRVAAAITGQAAAATDGTIETGATRDVAKTGRETINDPPGYYLSNWANRTVVERKNASAVGVTGISFGDLGAMQTTVTSNVVRQVFQEYGTGKMWTRSHADAVTWAPWAQAYNEARKPYFGSDLLEAAGGALATLSGFKTILGIAASVTGQTAWATATNITPANVGQQVAGLGLDGYLLSGLRDPFSDTASFVTSRLLMGWASGANIAINPEFLNGLAGWSAYNNAGGTKLSVGLVADATAPNSSGQVLRISYDGSGAPDNNPQPGFGGAVQFLNDGGATARPGFYARGTVVYQRIIARIPIGRRLVWHGNAQGNERTVDYMTSMNGTGQWETYVFRVTIGRTGEFSSFGFLAVSDGPNTAFSWDIAKHDQIDASSSVKSYMGSTMLDELGAIRGRFDLVTLLGTAAAITGQGPGATAAGEKVLNNDQSGAQLRIAAPVGGAYSVDQPTVTGALKIRLPQSWTNTMMQFAVEVFDYDAGASVVYRVAGYNYAPGPNWENTAASMVGADAKRRTVRWGHDGTRCCIWIGEANSTWSYPKVRVVDFVAGYSNYAESQWDDDWQISFDQGGAQNVTKVKVAPNAGEAKYGTNVLEDSGAAATMSAFKTALGISSGFTGQSLWATLTVTTARVNYLKDDGTMQLGAGNGLLTEDRTQWLTNGGVITALGQAASILGQSFLATNYPGRLGPHPDYGATYLQASLIAYTAAQGGDTVGGLRPGEAGANVTEIRIAAAFLGQGGLATKDQTNTPDIVNNAVTTAFTAAGQSANVPASGGQINVATLTVNITSATSTVRMSIAGIAGLPGLPARNSMDIRIVTATGLVLDWTRISTAVGYGQAFCYFDLLVGLSGSQTFTVQARAQFPRPNADYDNPSISVKLIIEELKK